MAVKDEVKPRVTFAIRPRPRVRRKEMFKYVLLIPMFVLLLLLFVYPIVYALHSTFEGYMYGRATGYVGIENWSDVFHDVSFWASLGRTLIYSVIAIPIELVLSVGLALVYSQITGIIGGMLRTVAILPFIVMPLVKGIIWKLIFLPNFGVADAMEVAMGLKPVDWLGTNKGAVAAVIIMDFWMWIPFLFLIILAGLQALPEEPFEAALVDGANAWQRFVKITLPLLRQTLMVAVILRVIDAFRIFDQVYSMTGGGPGVATQFLSLHVADVAFNQTDFGHASVQLFIIFVIMLFLVSIFYVLSERDAK
ncbi:sugar ABC transporter permease [Alicyclobacillus mali]|uniref:Sugar ABC transporter permease n=1 Tax=Alicyclobacillus mali (ex Roth et al. 2021) TaxID=1123961 RepID=A0ABS0F0Q8_9BACL|nr:sugar ABC transporter permease [Alicyclobacillus mali (ex Roth et al. 2021)]MBF8376850.1 sugar ABC transporter permease [Alicyclobacillus mali (ex Roth et al. 2021)]